MIRRWWPLGVSLLFAGIGVAAGVWQVGRAHYKESLRQRYDAMLKTTPVNLDASTDPAALDLQRISVRGHWLAERTIFLDNRVLHGQVGYDVLTPLQVEGTARLLLINRGWTPLGPDRSNLPDIATPAGVVTLQGMARKLPPAGFRLGQDAPGARVWEAIDPQHVSQAFGGAMLSLVVEQTSDSDDGLVREWTRPDFGIDMHRGYAFQWFGLTTVSIVFAGMFLRRQLHPETNT